MSRGSWTPVVRATLVAVVFACASPADVEHTRVVEPSSADAEARTWSLSMTSRALIATSDDDALVRITGSGELLEITVDDQTFVFHASVDRAEESAEASTRASATFTRLISAIRNAHHDAVRGDLVGDPRSTADAVECDDPLLTRAWRVLAACSLPLSPTRTPRDCLLAIASSGCLAPSTIPSVPILGTRHPIILVHGYAATPGAPSTELFGIGHALRSRGHVVYEPSLPPVAASRDRGMTLAQTIREAARRTGKVNVIAHSQGGIDARYAISALGLGRLVASLTTIATPHRGTASADVLRERLQDPRMVAIANAILAVYFSVFTSSVERASIEDALGDLTVEAAAERNARLPDVRGVHYQSWAAVATESGLIELDDERACDGRVLGIEGRTGRFGAFLRAIIAVVGTRLAAHSDGVTTIESAKWGHFRGCVQADHLAVIGQPFHFGADPWTGYDARAFFTYVAHDLAVRGF